ncbi:MAG TPA: hypothetical protein VHR45_04060 [Thermoanaerobaculia bacterium]|nr:hypothetical protein [Thermoanaerobaculia bacterium]
MSESGHDEVRFEELRSQGESAALAGRLAEAREVFEEGLACARRIGDPRLIDLAICNRAYVNVELSQSASDLPQLREILLRNGDPSACCLAARHLSKAYELQKNYKKSLFYARLMRDRAQLVGRIDWLASSHNQLGNAFLGDSFVDNACLEYKRALDLLPVQPNLRRAIALDNLGYCRILQGRPAEAYALLFKSLRMLRHLRADFFSILPHLDLSFLHLEAGRYTYARKHSLTALRLAEANDQTDAIKNALYLLGEVAHLAGDADGANEFFHRLQHQFFPGASYLPALLVAVDVRRLINLHA